jgi:Ca2+-binding RTX toxin-like protein
MADFLGTNNNDSLTGTSADDRYIDPGVGVDTIKDPGGNDTIDISSASSGAIVDLIPGKTSTIGTTGSFTLGSLIVGDNPDIVFVADTSGSTSATAQGVSVGDLNNDGLINTILDGEIAGFIALNQSLIDRGLGDTARVSLVAFDSFARQVGTTTTPKTDANGNGIYDIVESLKSLQIGGGTDYEAGLTKAKDIFQSLNTPTGKGNLVFLSDGQPNSPRYDDEVAALKNLGYNLRAFGVGTGSNSFLPALQVIDSGAKTFTTTDQLVAEFSIQGGTGSSTETFIETFIGTGFNDTISGNNLSNNINGGGGDDTIGGVNAAGVTPGKGEVDTLTGGVGKDIFVLGSGSTVYYDDGDAEITGTADYALITDFNPAEDNIQLSGSVNNYRLDNGISGQALYLDVPNSTIDELIAIFQGSSGLDLSQPPFTPLPPTPPTPIVPTITIVNTTNASEPNTAGTLTLTRSGDTSAALSVNITTTGTATSGVDYQAIAATVDFAAGSTTQTVTITPIDDTLVEGSENISVTIAPSTTSTYNVGTAGSATIDLTDDDVTTTPPTPPVSVDPCTEPTGLIATNNNTTTAADDIYIGDDSINIIGGGDGNDTMLGNGGNDTFYGDNGDDKLYGGDGNDTLFAWEGSDLLVGGNGDDILGGDNGDDKIYGCDGNDSLYGGNGNDKVEGGEGNDVMVGDAGDDDLRGGNGNDIIYAGEGKDVVDGNGGDDTINGGSEDDMLYGAHGSDTIFGGDGNDVLNGGIDDDILVGESGCNIYEYDGVVFDFGIDTIVGFQQTFDVISLHKSVFTNLASAPGLGLTGSGDFATVTDDAAAGISDAKIVYNTSNGKLFYNQDGSTAGYGAGGQFAVLTNGTPSLTANDFKVV